VNSSNDSPSNPIFQNIFFIQKVIHDFNNWSEQMPEALGMKNAFSDSMC